MSASKFIYSRSSEDTLNDKKVKKSEFLRDGAKGLTFSFFHLDSKKNKYLKISGKLSDDGKTVNVTIKEEGKEPVTKDLKLSDLKKMKNLNFVTNYISKDMAKFRKSLSGGKKRKTSRKKKSRKTSRRRRR